MLDHLDRPTHRSPLTPRRLLAVAGTASLLTAALAVAGEWPEFPISVADANAHAEERFQALDSDGNGEISAAEFAAAPRRGDGPGHGPAHHHPRFGGHGWNREDGQAAPRIDEDALFERLDSNGDDQLSRDEFDIASMREARAEAFHEMMFEQLDRNGSGGLDRTELPSPSRWLQAMDSDGDGMVTQAEARAHRQSAGGRHWHRDGVRRGDDEQG